MTLDVHRAIRKSRFVSVVLDRRDRRRVGLWIEVPDTDSYWALTDEGGPWDSDRSRHEEFEDLLSRRLGMVLTVTPFCIEDFPVE
ncbi:hypothetical protein [Streptomyces sp. NPDC051561]|uniref:hypothetical protein n=1 Tax=Streptomyces sp. NPDC051561 TaxID=3365658 RepID=UPI0037A37A26